MSLEARLEALTHSVNTLISRIDTLIAGGDAPAGAAPGTDAAENTGATQATTTKTTTAAKPTPAKAPPSLSGFSV